MIVRLVKLSISPEKVEDFKNLFDRQKSHIRNFPGCMFLELLQQDKGGNVFYTHSHWESEVQLEEYRQSELFQTTWSETKPFFCAKAEAISLNSIHKLN